KIFPQFFEDFSNGYTSRPWTKSSGTFTIKGQALTLSTAVGSGGNIIIQPDTAGVGNVQILTSASTGNQLRIQNANLTDGSLISGYIGNTTDTPALLMLSSGSSETEKFAVRADGQTRITTDATLADGALIVNQAGTGDIFTASQSGATKFVIKNDGKVGIGITNPSQELTVSGDLYVTGGYYDSSGDIGTSGQVLSSTATGTNWIASSSVNFWQRNSGALSPQEITNSLNLGATATTSALVHLAGTPDEDSFVNTGDFGIGTTAPNQKLAVAGNIDATGRLALADATISDNVVAYLTETYNNDANTYGIYNNITNQNTLTANRSQYGIINRLYNSSDDGSYSLNLYGTDSYVVNNDGYDFDSAYGGVLVVQNNDTSKTSTASAGVRADTYNNGAGTITTGRGVWGRSYADAGTITSAFGGYFQAFPNNASATLGTSYGVYGQSYVSAGSTTTGYGGYFIASGATTNYGAYISGTQFGVYSAAGTNYFSGSVGIGLTNPSQELTVSGDLYVTGGYYDSSGDIGSSGQILSSTGTGTNWTASTSVNFWQRNDGVLSPQEITNDLAIGGTATSSATSGRQDLYFRILLDMWE
ncbi:MAG: hypothetical protein UX62_C0058G0001, partial [Microgenomates group bacterium GW2011_GWA2_46_7]